MIQMDTQNDKGINLEQASAWIDEAALRGVKLVCFPEVMNLIGRNVGEGGGREQIPGYTTDILCRKAKEHGIYIHGGSITEEAPGEKRSANTSVLISPEGKILASYSKLHMFDITLADGTPFNESDKVRPGEKIVTVETELGVFGMSICYDVRFPEMYRLMTLKGAQVIFVPASFTMPTGKDHWEPSLSGQSHRERSLHCGAGADWKETGLCGLWQQPCRRSVGDRNSTGKGCTWDHICGDRSGLSGSNQKTDSFPGKQENRFV